MTVVEDVNVAAETGREQWHVRAASVILIVTFSKTGSWRVFSYLSHILRAVLP